MEQKHMFTNKMIADLLIPVVLEQLLNSIMGTADTMMVSNVGSAAISAVSLVDSINVLVIQAFSALAAGGAIGCAQYIGQKNVKRANESARQVLFIITAISVVISLICLVFQKPMLRLIFGSVEAEVMRASEIYFFYTALSFPFIAAYDSAASIFRAQDNTKGPMLISMISNVMNIAGNAMLIWGFHMGVAGAALATLISRVFCAVVVLAQLRQDRQPIVVRDYLKIRPDFRMIRRILSIGIPSGVENSMFQLGKLAIQSSVSTLGTVAIAAQAMTSILENLNGIAAIGVGVGLMTIVGQCIGAGRKDEAVYYIKKLCMIAEVILIISCLSVFVLTKTDHDPWWYGKRKCGYVYPYDDVDHDCKAIGMDYGIYPGLWYARSRGCEIFNAHILHDDVAVPFLPQRIYDPDSWCRSDGRVDRNVFRLDTPWDYFFVEIPQQKVAEASGDLKFLHRFYMADPLDFTYLC